MAPTPIQRRACPGLWPTHIQWLQLPSKGGLVLAYGLPIRSPQAAQMSQRVWGFYPK